MDSNLERWQKSQLPQEWVRKHIRGWNHRDWLSLIENLKATEYWPMDEASVGIHLEELKRRLSEYDRALLAACKAGDAEKVKSLLVDGADANTRSNQTALMFACESGSLVSVKSLLESGANVNHTNDGKNALMITVMKAYKDIASVLIDAGVDVNARGSNYDTETALMMAVDRNDHEMVTVLIKGGADPNVQQRYNRKTALMVAIEAGRSSCALAIIAARTGLELQDHIGETALMKAVERDASAIVEALIAAGADVNAENDNGTTVLEMASRKVRATLRRAGARRKIRWAIWLKNAGIVAGCLVLAAAVTALTRWLAPLVPLWADGLLGLFSAPAMAVCVAFDTQYNEFDIRLHGWTARAHRLLMFRAWVVLTVSLALISYFFCPQISTWEAAVTWAVFLAAIPSALLALTPVEWLTEPTTPRRRATAPDDSRLNVQAVDESHIDRRNEMQRDTEGGSIREGAMHRRCSNHPDAVSLAKCNSCGRRVCANCLRVETFSYAKGLGGGGSTSFYCSFCKPTGSKPPAELLAFLKESEEKYRKWQEAQGR